MNALLAIQHTEKEKRFNYGADWVETRLLVRWTTS